jgi:hypothetical protein
VGFKEDHYSQSTTHILRTTDNFISPFVKMRCYKNKIIVLRQLMCFHTSISLTDVTYDKIKVDSIVSYSCNHWDDKIVRVNDLH